MPYINYINHYMHPIISLLTLMLLVTASHSTANSMNKLSFTIAVIPGTQNALNYKHQKLVISIPFIKKVAETRFYAALSLT